MILHKNHQFIYNHTAAMELPNGLCIQFDSEILPEDGFNLIAPDGSFRVVIEFFTSNESTKKIIEDAFEPGDYDLPEPPYAIETSKGLHGYAMMYRFSREIYEEFAIEFTKDVRCNFWLYRKLHQDYDLALWEQAKNEILSSLCLV